ncbi:MAG: right-handed parallel beta-helix repeat-containing protein [Planctomycetota bacterium]
MQPGRPHHKYTKSCGLTILALVALASLDFTSAATLEVGPGKRFSRIEEANAKAQAGDLILVYPRPGGKAYEKTAVFVRQKNLTFRAVPGAVKTSVQKPSMQPGKLRDTPIPEMDSKPYVTVSGQGFDYSGAGSTPRAIFQFNPGTDNCTLQGFELFGAHNSSHNGAGVRINQANHVVLQKCSIHNNDMGIMSNGDGSLATAVDQRIEECRIYRNGDPTEPGYNHNLYLGGTSVTLRFCEIHHSLTGHNVKSRAHHTRVEYCFVYHSANREFDLVDAAETVRLKSDAVLLGNVIVKDPKCSGNRTVIHFGQDGGKGHNGTLHLAFNTVVTPFISPVVELSTVGAKSRMLGNIVASGAARQAEQKVAGVRGGAIMQNIGGESNWFCGDFSDPGTGLDAKTNHFEPMAGDPFLGSRDDNYRLTSQAAQRMRVASTAALLDLPSVPGLPDAAALLPLDWQYHHPAGREKRPTEPNATAGAFASSSGRR